MDWNNITRNQLFLIGAAAAIAIAAYYFVSPYQNCVREYSRGASVPSNDEEREIRKAVLQIGSSQCANTHSW